MSTSTCISPSSISLADHARSVTYHTNVLVAQSTRAYAEVDYSYEIYREAAERHNRRDFVPEHPGDAVYVPSLEEFVRILELRRRELLLMLDTWYKHEIRDPDSWFLDAIESCC